MANTHHTGIPKLQWQFGYPPCTPSVTIVADKNPFCDGDSVTFTPTYSCTDNVIITSYAWLIDGVSVSTSSDPYVTNTLTSGRKVLLKLTLSTGQVIYSNVIIMQNKTEGCITEIKYGLLYNWYAATDVRLITSSNDWIVPSTGDQNVLQTYLGGSTIAGGKLKESGLAYWKSPNTGATNIVNFNSRGTGWRNAYSGLFEYILEFIYLWSSSEATTSGRVLRAGVYNGTGSILSNIAKRYGSPVRLMRSATAPEQLLADGTACAPYSGNDGKRYRTVKIGTQVWLADNLAETKFRNGDAIPEITDNAAWAALTTGALCAYNNSWDNV